MHARSSTLAVSLAAILATGGLLAVTTMSGCERKNPTGKAVTTGAKDLHALAGGGASPAIAPLQKETYTKVSTAMQPVADGGRPGENAAASLILAQSQFGLTEIPSARTAELERESLNRLTVLRATLNQWTSQTVSAEAAESFNTSDLVSGNKARIAELDAQIVTKAKTKSDLEARVALLRSDAAKKKEAAKPHQLAYAELRQQAATLSAVAGKDLVMQANARKREGDALLNEAGLLDAQADLLQPQADEAALQVGQLTNQKASLERSNTELAAGQTSAKDEAAKARAEAAKAEKDLLGQLDDLRKLREGELAETTAATVSALQKAVASAKKSQSDSAAQAKISVGGFQQSIGDAHLQAASGHRQYAGFLASVASVKPAFPGADALREESTKVKEQEKAALEAAKGAYEDAKGSYSSAPSRGEVKERLQKVGETLDTVSKWVGGEAVDVSGILKVQAAKPAAAEPEATPAAGTEVAAAPAAGDEGVIQGMVARMLDAGSTGNVSGLRELYHTTSPEEAAFVDVSVAFQKAFGELDQATTKAFGERFVTAMARNPMMQQQASLLNAAADAKVSDYQIVVSGNAATATNPKIPPPVEFAKIDGKWKIVTQYAQQVAAMPEAQRPLLTKQFQVLGECAAQTLVDLNSGTLQSADAVVNAFVLKLQPAMMKMMTEMQQGGGG
jgi:hypothetical protein